MVGAVGAAAEHEQLPDEDFLWDPPLQPQPQPDPQPHVFGFEDWSGVTGRALTSL
jgi:hypothetical protein